SPSSSVTNAVVATLPTCTVTWTTDATSTLRALHDALPISGKCTVNYTPTAVGTGTHKITGGYGGDAKHATSTGSFDEAVGRRATAGSASGTTPVMGGDSMTTCAATETNGSGANIPTGTVRW